MEPDIQFSKEKRVIFFILGSLAVFLLCLLIFVAFPLTRKIYSSKDKLESEILMIQSLRSDLSHREKYRQLRDSIGESKDLLERAVLKEATIVTFIEDLEKTAEQTSNQIQIESYKPPKVKKKTSDDEKKDATEPKKETASAKTADANQEKTDSKAIQYFQLTLLGNYPGLLNFLAKLENLGYVFKIDTIDSKSKVGTNNIALKDVASMNQEEPKGNVETKIIIAFSLQK